MGLALGLAGCPGNDVTGGYSITTGSIALAVLGLPEGTPAAITISSTQGYHQVITGSVTLSPLAPGTYTISADEVVASGDHYAPTPASQTVTVVAGATPLAVSLAYLVTTGRLRVTLHGLPTGGSPVVVVTGPGGYLHPLSDSATITGLLPGTYAVQASSFFVSGDRYDPQPELQAVPIAAAALVVAPIFYSQTTGRLMVSISGAPSGAPAAVVVNGPNGFSLGVGETTILAGLTPGTYTVIAGMVSWGGNTFAPTPTAVSYLVTVAGPTETAQVAYALATGTLQIGVTGLPAGTPAAITVSGPQGFSASVTRDTTLTAVLVGEYTVGAAPVTSGSVGYNPVPASQTATVTYGSVVTSTVGYAITTGTLIVSISGLGPGVDASGMVTGPSSYSHPLTGSQTMGGLQPGSYTITAASVTSGGTTWSPSPASQSVNIQAAATTSLSVAYALTTGGLLVQVLGLPVGVSGSLSVTGPAGFSQSLTGSQALNGLQPGSYTVTAASVSAGGTTYVPAPAIQTATVTIGNSTLVAVTYSASGGGATLDLAVSAAYLVQATQRLDGSVPLVAGRDAYARVFAIANQGNSTIAQVRLRLYSGTTLIQTYTIPAPTTGVPTAVSEGVWSGAWNVLVPGALLQPGLRLLADVDPSGAIPESDETDNQFPAPGTPMALDVRALPTFNLRFVPVLQQVNGLQGNVSSANKESFLVDLKKMLPVGAYDADVRAVYTTTAPVLMGNDSNGAWGTILNEILALRSADGSARYYYGVVKTNYSSGIAGLGYVGGSARTAIGWDAGSSAPNVMAHELGHNMGRAHAPCGGAGSPDPGYPYAGGQIGVWGLDVVAVALKAPSVADLMSYCHPNWISDYNWSAMVAYRQAGPNNAPAADAGGGSGLLVWGRITETGLVLEPAFSVTAAPDLAPRAGPNRLDLLAADGSLLRTVSFDADPVADLPGGAERHFAFVLPLDAQTSRDLGGIRVRSGGRVAEQASRAGAVPADPVPNLSRPNGEQVEVRWDATRYPMVLVRDAATGLVLSFARGGVARVWSRGTSFDLLFSDGVRTVTRQGRVLR